MGTCSRALDMEEALDPVLFLCGEQQIYLNLWSLDILCISAFMVRKVIVHILK